MLAVERAKRHFANVLTVTDYDGSARMLFKNDVIRGVASGEKIAQNLVQGLPVRKASLVYQRTEERLNVRRVIGRLIDDEILGVFHGEHSNMRFAA